VWPIVRCRNSNAEVAGSNPGKCNLEKEEKILSCEVCNREWGWGYSTVYRGVLQYFGREVRE